MKNKKDLPRIVVIIIFLAIVSVVALTSFVVQDTSTSRGQAAFAGDTDISLEGYCRDGYYNIPGEKICSRAPNCGGLGYDDVAGKGAPDQNSCMSQTVEGRSGTSGCEGYVPVCCYEMVRTGDFTKCVGYWERLWCANTLCDQARSRGANDGQCGGDCKCGHAFQNYCGADKPAASLATRLGMAPQQTNTPVPPQPTNTPPPSQPTNTPVIQRPTSPPQPTQAQPTSGGIQPTQFTPPLTNTPPPTTVIQPTAYEVQPTATLPPPTAVPLEIQTPKEIIQEVINPESVAKLSQSTDKALSAPKEGFTRLRSVDQKLESTVQSLWMRAQMYFNEVF